MATFRGILGLLWKLYVGIIFVIFALALYPIFLVLLTSEKGKKISFRLFVFWSWMMRIFCLYHVKKVENAALPEGPYIIIANHSSYLDIFFMYSILPKHPFLFLGKGEILNYPILKTYFKGLNIPVHRKDRAKAAQSFHQAKKAVRQGWSIVIFPEGGIPDDDNPKMIPFKGGAFRLAKALEIPIVPITFTNHYKLFSDPEMLLGPARPGISRVYIHPAIEADKIAALGLTELMDECFTIINRPILEEHPHLR
ncbi:MAG: 1-acyl-sn-glycerol-3-phosphate acyltransferase [Crocinitomicaceae bacterium]|nr:MAG: 1-acyl-sn-glycerol-3-phosphate acyltransferase [Crocinitomicaceae bacterium]